MNNFLNINEVSQKNLKAIMEDASTVKSGSVSEDNYINCLKNSITGLLFEKPSTRTRLSFEAAVLKLGGQVLNLRKDEIHLGKGETLQDTSAMVSLFLDLLILISSTMEFQELQLRHFPKYWEVSVPQF